jgi:hypothetical protein
MRYSRIIGDFAPDCEVERLRAELDRLHSWDGLMELLDEHWPADIFTGESGDPGPRMIVAMREIDRLRSDLASVTATMLAIREQRDGYSAKLAALKADAERAGNAWQIVCDKWEVSYMALRKAAGKVKCWTCHGSGEIKWTSGSIMPLGTAPIPCPDCADLRKILGEKHE